MIMAGACTPAADTAEMEVGDAPEATAAAPAAPGAMVSTTCTPSDRMDVAGRTSPYDSVSLTLGGETAKVCYGRPYAKGRAIFGDLIPHGELWRTGANEPTTIHLPFAASIAGVDVEPGSYSIYTEPGESEWEIIVNRSTSQWGHEGQYTEAIRAEEAGRGEVAVQRADAPVEQFTIRTMPAGANEAHLVLEWENTQVMVPVVRR